MGMGLRDRLRAGVGTMEEWRRDRLADLAHGAAELEARGHQLYSEGLRNREDVLARTTSELREFAKHPQAAPLRPSQPPTRPSTPDSSRPPNTGGSLDQQLLENAKRLVAESQQKAEAALRRAGESRPVRQLAGLAANSAGNAVGVGTGAVHVGHDLVDGVVLSARLLDPTDPFRKPQGEAARDQVFGTLSAMGGSAKDAVTDSRGAAQELGQKGQKLLRETVPMATPEAPTLSGEIHRRFGIGRRQGELGVQAVPYAIGAGELKAISGLGALSKASRLEKYAKQGFTRAQAARLAKPYDGKGHHSILPERASLPGFLGGGPIPRAILDSPFNVVKPPRITQGDFYELHYGLDPDWRGTKVGRKGRWSGKKLGLQRYDLPERIWYGTPNATKQAIDGAGVAGTIPFGNGDPQ